MTEVLDGSRLWDRAQGLQGGLEFGKPPRGLARGRRLMSELWCRRSVSAAPGKGVRGQQGQGEQDMMEESQTSARKLWSQP